MHVLARQVKRIRTQRELSHEQLAQRLTAIGVPWTRQVVTKLEGDRRQTITPEELNALALALEVPPVLLLFPVFEVAEVEILPGRKVDPWSAVKWFSGEAPLGIEDREEFERGVAPLVLAGRHARILRAYVAAVEKRRLQDQWDAKERSPAEPVVRVEWAGVQKNADFYCRELRDVRSEIRRHGWKPPQLPEGLADTDLG